MWRALRNDIERVGRRVDRLTVTTQRAETAGGVPACTLAEAPTAATGGLSDGTSYIDLLWISDGLRPGEGSGNGTGVLAFYDSATDAWIAVHDYQPVAT